MGACPTPYRRAASDALIRWFAEYGAREADELHVGGSMQPLPGDDLAQRGLYREQSAVPSYWVALDLLVESDGELYPVLSSNARQQLRRAIRHFEKFGKLRLDRASDRGEAREFFAELKELHIATWQSRGKPHAFSRPFFEAFHQELIERHVADGVVQLLRASAGSRLIGYLYNFRFSDRVYAYQSGFAYGERRAGPGCGCACARDPGCLPFRRLRLRFSRRPQPPEGELCDRERANALGRRSAAASGVSGRTSGAPRQASTRCQFVGFGRVKRCCLRDGKAIGMRQIPRFSGRDHFAATVTERPLFMSILVTGAAGFIGFHVARMFLDRGERVIGIDNLNDYYDVSLKEARLARLQEYHNFSFAKADIADRDQIFDLVDHIRICGT